MKATQHDYFRDKKPWHQQFRRATKEERTVDGITFDSVGEMQRWGWLRIMERNGLISDLRRQVRFPLVLPNKVPIVLRSTRTTKTRGDVEVLHTCVYTADFVYTRAGCTVVEEFKGHDDDAGRLRRAVAEAIYGIRIEVVSAEKG